MIEIIPNWHPIFVHFTIALFTAAFGFSVLAYVLQLNHLKSTLAFELEIVGRWCLWAAAFITLATVGAGLYAYNTVHHDEPGHFAMQFHRNWALTTAIFMWLAALWSLWRYYKRKKVTITFLLALLIIQILVLTTAWLGGELVYRHGLGVLSLPQVESEQHHHHSEME